MVMGNQKHTPNERTAYENMLNALKKITLPGDVDYSKNMSIIYSLGKEAWRSHQRMVECYEDGLTTLAERYAKLTAHTLSEISMRHLQMAKSFSTLPNDAIDTERRYSGNKGAELANQNRQ